ncbi:NUMOD4 domain-containing protein [Rhizobium sp. Nf11,1]|uniref:NUMOD4 domain-containing protein n=1 Tax=Rhizobium sp. Nf11,1 TaxID=3404923 RepID=UPI003D347A79
MQLDIAAEWRVIPQYPNYEVSSIGQVRSLSRWKILRPRLRNKYWSVSIFDGRRILKKPIHRLVALAFLGSPPPGKELACHKDGNRDHNWKRNIYWGSPKDNAQDSVRHGTKARGSESSAARHDEGKVKAIRCLAILKISDCEIGRLLNMPHPTVRDIRLRRSWNHI